jgi:hypothetical protein
LTSGRAHHIAFSLEAMSFPGFLGPITSIVEVIASLLLLVIIHPPATGY